MMLERIKAGTADYQFIEVMPARAAASAAASAGSGRCFYQAKTP